MADVPTLQPELSRSVSALARSLVATARSWALYPPDHPPAGGSFDRFRHAIAEARSGRPFSFGVTPETLPIEGIPVSGRDLGSVSEAAGRLNDREILQITVAGPVETRAWLHAWEPDDRGGYPWTLIDGVDADGAGIDLLAFK